MLAIRLAVWLTIGLGTILLLRGRRRIGLLLIGLRRGLIRLLIRLLIGLLHRRWRASGVHRKFARQIPPAHRRFTWDGLSGARRS